MPLLHWNSRSGLLATLFFPVCLIAHAAGPAPVPDDQLIRQQQRERVQQEQQDKAPDVRLQSKAPDEAAEKLPEDETPCFTINRLTLRGDDAGQFAWALAAATANGDSPLGSCLGTNGINLVMKRIQNAIIKEGYITTRVLAEPQDLKHGTLDLTIIPGRIRAVRFAEGTNDRATWRTALPMGPGDILNLRDIEQALEKMKRVPTAEADIQITPSAGPDAKPGDSDLVIRWQQAMPFRLTLAADDAGSKYTGRYQGSLTVSADHLLTLHDLFYLTLNRDLDDQDSRHGTRGNTVHYSLPIGYWLVSFTSSSHDYHQVVQGSLQDTVYSGTSTNSDLRLSRIVRRDAISKTTLGFRLWQRESKNYTDDTEVRLQRRRTAGWEISLAERRFIHDATLDASLAYRHGTGAFGALDAPEEGAMPGASRPTIVSADLQLVAPFNLGGQSLRYNGTLRAQWNDSPLVPQDRFAIGGRYTVRGFDGETLLSAERGWLLRNDLSVALGASGQELYLGLDYGEVAGAATEYLVGRRLAGTVLGLRGTFKGLSTDLFIGQPLSKPEGFRTAATTAGFSLTWTF
ncbi:MAG: hypothetical protein CVU31_14820 [Betaproteobacteria bacterium HGW-Betaproteobacteria-4]|jgi:hemolysin activation/secretion protein|nr:MAG: hypothetical protein CVU31_14820 [Betaproteobacteria bacterium HGW-Betaproteobacteria-4]